MTPHDAAQLVEYMIRTWPTGRRDIDGTTAATYAGHLVELDKDEAKAAVDRLARTMRWFPAIADIFAEVTRGRRAGELSPGEAWALVLDEMRRVGRYKAPELPEKVAAIVRQVGGWGYLCGSTNPMSDRARFLECYEHAQEREARCEQLGSLAAPMLPSSEHRFLRGKVEDE